MTRSLKELHFLVVVTEMIRMYIYRQRYGIESAIRLRPEDVRSYAEKKHLSTKTLLMQSRNEWKMGFGELTIRGCGNEEMYKKDLLVS